MVSDSCQVAARRSFFRNQSIAVTVLGNLNGLKLTRQQLACQYSDRQIITTGA